MPPTPTGGEPVDRVVSTLAEIRERNEKLRHRYGYVGGLLALADAKDDVPRLLAAIEAVLRSAETWRALAGDSQAPFDVAIASCAKTVREVITTALAVSTTGEESR